MLFVFFGLRLFGFLYWYTLGRLPAGPTFFGSPKKVAKKRDLRKTAFFLRTFSFTSCSQKQQRIIFRLPPERRLFEKLFFQLPPEERGSSILTFWISICNHWSWQRKKPLLFRLWRRSNGFFLLECLIQIFQDVVDVFRADGEADCVWLDAALTELILAQLRVGGAGRVGDEGLDVAHVG